MVLKKGILLNKSSISLKILLPKKDKDRPPTPEELEDDYGELWNDEQGIVNPSSFLRCFKEKIKKYNFYFESFNQNDVEEFITRLMELLHKAIERKITFQIDGIPENNMDR